jgi:hypothetical protein
MGRLHLERKGEGRSEILFSSNLDYTLNTARKFPADRIRLESCRDVSSTVCSNQVNCGFTISTDLRYR